MQNIIAILITLSTVYAQNMSAQYTQYWQYPKSDCLETAFYISSQKGGQCAIAGTPSDQCTPESGSVGVYSSERTTCSTSPLVLTGITQLFVGKYSWTSSSSCDGNADSVEAVMADATCHAVQSTQGVVTSWLSVNCNGGKPLYSTCANAGCSNCTIVTYDGKCNQMGAGASMQVKCLYPPGFNNGAGGSGLGFNPNGDLTGDASLITFSALSLTAIIALL